MEDQEGKSPSNFLVTKFFFLQLPWKYEDRSAFKNVLTTDRRFKSAFRT